MSIEKNRKYIAIVEAAEDLHDLSNALTLANEGVECSLVNSLLVLTIDKLDEISYSIKENMDELKDLIEE